MKSYLRFLVKIELIYNVSYCYEYGVRAMLPRNRTSGSCKQEYRTEFYGNKTVERSWRGWVVGDGPETALVGG